MKKKIFKKVICSELFKGFISHTHKRAYVMPKPQSFTRNTEENPDILDSFKSVVFSLNWSLQKNIASPVAWTC